MKKGDEINYIGSGVGTGRSLVADMDFNEIELRVLAHMREDAERMGDDEGYRRPEDLSGFDTAKVKALLTLRDAEKILREGTVNPVDAHKKKAAELFGVEESEVTPAQREFAKCYTFADYYGCRDTFPEFLDKLGLPEPITGS